MAQKFEIKGLGNPAAAGAAAVILKDKEVYRDVKSGINKTVKFLGITAGLITVAIVTKKIVKKIKQHKEEKDMDKSIDEDKLSYNSAWYTQQAKVLVDAMPPGAFLLNNYIESDIIGVLELLKNSSDFWRLAKDFQKQDEKKRGLIQALKGDDGWDIAKYRDILKKIGISL